MKLPSTASQMSPFLAPALAAFLAAASADCLSADPAPARQSSPVQSIVVIDSEPEGDLGDAPRTAELLRRSAALTRTLKTGLEAQKLYHVLDSDPSREPLARFAGRKELHACPACLQEAAQALGGGRVLSAWVFRMSNLVLELHAELRDGKTGAVVWQRSLGFRGDNDRSWERATSYLIRELRETPEDKR